MGSALSAEREERPVMTQTEPARAGHTGAIEQGAGVRGAQRPLGAVVLGRTVEGLVAEWRSLGGSEPIEGDARDRLLELVGLGVHAVLLAVPQDALADLEAQLPACGRVWAIDEAGQRWALDGSRRAVVGVGPSSDGSSDCAWAADVLQSVGLTGSLVAYLGVDPGETSARSTYFPEPDEATVVALLDEQLARRSARNVPAIDEDATWTVVVDDSGQRPRHQAHVRESLLTVGDGRFGTRGVLEEDGEGDPLVVAAGVYDDEPNPTLLHGPLWTSLLTLQLPDIRERRLLDLRSGVLLRERANGSRAMRTARFMSMARPGTAALRAEAPAAWLAPARTLHLPDGARNGEEGGDGARRWAVTRGRGRSGIAAAAETTVGRVGSMRTVERVAAYVADQHRAPPPEEALAQLDVVQAMGFDALLREQRAAMAARWADAEVAVEGDDDLTLAVRFALFHLMTSVPSVGEAPVGARGLSGGAYGGHVLWDADIYVLPVMAAVWAPAAQAMLHYRLRRLGVAQSIAAAHGFEGARFPWESGDVGTDITPRLVRQSGQIVPIHTGLHEEHIISDVAWAAMHYASWTGDRDFIDGEGRALVIEPARYWASRIRIDRHGDGHVYGVVGPDEYHEIVDDNAYTNVLARWTLRRAAELVERDGRGGTIEEALRWREIAACLVDGFDPATQLYEQCAGFFRLEPYIVRDEMTVPVMADERLGRDRVRRAQVLKQPDVLMLHHLVPDAVAPGSLAPNLDFYWPRTAHGSSLSPAVHASLLARAGRLDDAVALFRMAGRLDLDDLTGTSARGIHTATAGSVWQALVWGFAGIRPDGEALAVDPHLPAAWDAIVVTVRFHGTRLRFRIDHDAIEVAADGPATLRLPDGSLRAVTPPGARFPR